MVSLPQLNDIPADIQSFVEEKKRISTKNLQDLLLQAGEPYENPPAGIYTLHAFNAMLNIYYFFYRKYFWNRTSYRKNYSASDNFL